jgi:hypothetical protein
MNADATMPTVMSDEAWHELLEGSGLLERRGERARAWSQQCQAWVVGVVRWPR